MDKLDMRQVNSVVSYIGVHNGYLGDLKYASHSQFYPEYCGLDIDLNQYEGTTRNRFITILSNVNSSNQAKILRGVIEKYPLAYFEHQLQESIITKFEFEKKKELYERILKWRDELAGQGLHVIDDLELDSKFVREVLDQCETLITQHSFSSAVDRAHTVLHAYLLRLRISDGNRWCFAHNL